MMTPPPRPLLVNLDAEPEDLEEAVDVAGRLARMNHLLLVGWAKELEAGIPELFQRDLDTIREVVFALDLRMWTVRRFLAEPEQPADGGPDNVVPLHCPPEPAPGGAA